MYCVTPQHGQDYTLYGAVPASVNLKKIKVSKKCITSCFLKGQHLGCQCRACTTFLASLRHFFFGSFNVLQNFNVKITLYIFQVKNGRLVSCQIAPESN